MRISVSNVTGRDGVVEVMNAGFDVQFFGVKIVERLAIVHVVPAIAWLNSLCPSWRRRGRIAA